MNYKGTISVSDKIDYVNQYVFFITNQKNS
jgi:hypothetical protein